MSVLTATQLSDRIAIRDLVDAYAHHADRRDPVAQASVFAEHGTVELYDGDPATSAPLAVISGRDRLAAEFTRVIAQYEQTSYLNGQCAISLNGDTASAETYCMAFHIVARNGGGRDLLTMAIRYLDDFVRAGDDWAITRRRLIFDWRERRSVELE